MELSKQGLQLLELAMLSMELPYRVDDVLLNTQNVGLDIAGMCVKHTSYGLALMYEVIQLCVLRLIRHPIVIVSIVHCRTSDIANHQPKGPQIPRSHVVRSDDLLPRLSILSILRWVSWSTSHSV